MDSISATGSGALRIGMSTDNMGPAMTHPSAKRVVLEQLLEQGMVLVTLDATMDGVDVPAHLKNDTQLRLNLSYRFGLPMEVNDHGVRATLTFGGVPYDCRIPWESLYLVVSHVTGRPVLFPDDVPRDLIRAVEEEAAGQGLSLEGEPAFRVIEGDGRTSSDNEPPPPPAETTTSKPAAKRGHLRVIK